MYRDIQCSPRELFSKNIFFSQKEKELMTTKDIIWLAGLLEGEGCFRTQEVYPILTVGMTDKDIVQRVSTILGSTMNGPYIPKYPKGKPVYTTSLCGKKAVEWMMTILPMMGIRRSAKIIEVITQWKIR